MATLIPLLFELWPAARLLLGVTVLAAGLVGLAGLQAEMRRSA